ncbi:MAG: carbonic anhydrase [Alphaproteobacteria bacterium]
MSDSELGSKLKLLKGFNEFRTDHYDDGVHSEEMRQLIDKQNPKTLIISCSDSRVSPEIIFGADVGDIFGEQQVAALVMPYDKETVAQNSVAASVEYGIEHLGVEEVIVMGHTKCGGIQALVNTVESCDDLRETPLSDAQEWVLNAKNVVLDAKASVIVNDDLVKTIEEHSIIWSLNNLKNYPSIKAGLEDGSVVARAWQFDLESGHVREYDEATGGFDAIDGQARDQALEV